MRAAKESIEIRRCWQAGLTLSQASKRLKQRGFYDTVLLIKEWRIMKKVFGCASANVSYVNGYCPPTAKPAKRQYDAAELNQLVTAPMYGSTYGNWLGITGPGARLKEIIKT